MTTTLIRFAAVALLAASASSTADARNVRNVHSGTKTYVSAIITCDHGGCSDGLGAGVASPAPVAGARSAAHRPRPASRAAGRAPQATGAGVIRSAKTGATASVAARNRAAFQAYIDDLEQNHGATVRFMGGYRRGPCSERSEHPCGNALDVCQLARGIVAHGQIWRGRRQPDCNLPAAPTLAAIASAHKLFEGGLWCHSDYGHAQTVVTAKACSSRVAHGAPTHRRMAAAR